MKPKQQYSSDCLQNKDALYNAVNSPLRYQKMAIADDDSDSGENDSSEASDDDSSDTEE